MNARSALFVLLTLSPAFASATQVILPSEAAVRGSYGKWEIAIREPETTSVAFDEYLHTAPTLDAIKAELQSIYHDRVVVVDEVAHTLRVSDSERRLPLLLSEYRRRYDHEPPVIPETQLPDELDSATKEDWMLAMRPVGTVRPMPLANGQPSLTCDIRGAVILTGWGPDKRHPLRGARTIPVDGVDVELSDVETGKVFKSKTAADGRYTIAGIPMPEWRDARGFREAVLIDGIPVPVPNPIAVCAIAPVGVKP